LLVDAVDCSTVEYLLANFTTVDFYKTTYCFFADESSSKAGWLNGRASASYPVKDLIAEGSRFESWVR
jgi:hypothetical protein